MKKKLLFSLLLGSAFAWMNEVYAADTAAAPAAEKAKPTGDAKEEEKKYKAVGLDDKEIEVQFFDKSKHPDFVLKKLFLQDGGAYSKSSDSDPRNVPYAAGELLPEGSAVVNVFRKSDSPDELKFTGPGVGNVDGHTSKAEEFWMYFDGKFLYPYTAVTDPNGKLILGNDKVQVYSYEIIDSEATAKAKELEDTKKQLEEAKKNGGGGSPEDAARVKELETQIEELKKNAGNGAAPAVDPSAPLTKTFQFEGMNFVIITSDPAAKSHPELFEELKSNLYKLFSIQPKVGTAIAAMMLKSHESLDGSQGEFVKILVADAYKLMGSDKTINLVAELQFPTEVAYQDAYAYVEGLKNKYNRDDAIREATQPVSAEEAARRQAEHENELAAERAKAETELAAERAKGEEILEQLEQITKEKAAAEAEMKLAEEEKEKAIQQRNVAIDVGIEIASSAIDQADQKAQMAAQNAQIAAQNAQIATHNAQIAAQKDAQVQSVEEALNESELEKRKALINAEAEKARLAAAHQQTQSTLEETKNDLMETKISEATLTAQHNAAKEAAEKAEKDAAAVKKQLEDAHGALLDVATSTSNSTENVTAEQVAQDLDDANKHAPITREEQVTAAALTASAPLPLSNSMVISDKKTASIIPDINKIAPGTVSTVTPAE